MRAVEVQSVYPLASVVVTSGLLYLGLRGLNICSHQGI